MKKPLLSCLKDPDNPNQEPSFGEVDCVCYRKTILPDSVLKSVRQPGYHSGKTFFKFFAKQNNLRVEKFGLFI